MTLANFNPKLNDLQNRPLVVVCYFLFAVLVTVIPWLVYENKAEISRNASAERTLQLTIDSMNRAQIVLYRNMALGEQENQELKEDIQRTDSILRKKTEKSVIKILSNQ